ncbi:hypothetical protein DIQ79_21520 [Mycolicibacterium smegmatis]|uniref:Uncharacterized protein n=1 Tax=Mycolicibacterium smegmatis (strain ATCC 700084 / mc(2)155) TaxID=246196 RepID=A0QSW7_MYCS2|nr:hypothetical protein MSMEG_1627 [Mycolicibacterium smegmatis MC2 155]TBM46369.1 hypothetical protein DIQ86_13535 [Mycolicibacterium smegmatis]TBH33791.1 hypothetical protein EYS45_20875 [Mycolicibacterium smegmatis MC2 155]TBM49131.1 hypothetical protein DIQ85_21775 [Mycolicibacterium smegmatis]TBM58905.1 hypothetical protein DIQ83_21585 [Mycolicibacterium smegmatis]
MEHPRSAAAGAQQGQGGRDRLGRGMSPVRDVVAPVRAVRRHHVTSAVSGGRW